MIKPRTYKVIRVIQEQYEVLAFNKEDAKRKAQDPYSVIVVREKVEFIKQGTTNSKTDKL